MSRTVDDLAGHGALAVADGEEPVGLRELAGTVALEHVGPGLARGVQIAMVGDEEVTVPGSDPAAVGSAVGNFLSNAIRYAPRGSTVVVDWGTIDAWAWLSVTDEGSGLAPEHHARVFERGWQGAHDRDRIGGSGLGLTIARQLTEAQGGAVTLVSEEGGGATFALWLPLGTGSVMADVIGADGIHPRVEPWAKSPATA
jgi:two-component system sensor histidine kinase BaeS